MRRALADRLERLQRERRGRRLADDLDEIALSCASLPVLDDRPADEIIAFGPEGAPN